MATSPKPRKRISTEVKERLVRAFEEPTEDYLMVADKLDVNRSTARGIVAKYIREGRVEERPRGGRNNVKMDDEIIQCINDILDGNCMPTLREINRELQRRLPGKPRVHDRTIARALDGMIICLKHASHLPIDRNRPDVIEGRFEYANWFLNIGVVGHCVFVDGCEYNIWTARSSSRAANGETAYRQVCGQRGKNISICMAISARIGLVHQSAEIEGMTAQRFGNFLLQTRQCLPPNDRVIFIYDNAPVHCYVNNLDENTELKPIPAYSCFLNIVEQAISWLKASLKAHLSSPEQQQLMKNREEARRQGLPLGEYRKRLLLRSSTKNMNSITPEKCFQWYNYMQTYLPKCLNREDIKG